jgi:hypothetical protein
MVFLKKIEIWLLCLAAIFFSFSLSFEKPKAVFNANKMAPPIEIKYLTAGMLSQVADSFWLSAIQDIEYCEKMQEKGLCEGKSWFFNVINLVIELDKFFPEAYYFGGLSLTVFINDIPGASIIFEKAVSVYKYEWPILYLAAYHALFQEKDKLKASRLYLRAGENGAPPWVRLSAGKLAAQGGDENAAVEILEQLIRVEADPLWVKKLKEHLNEAKQDKSNEIKK